MFSDVDDTDIIPSFQKPTFFVPELLLIKYVIHSAPTCRYE